MFSKQEQEELAKLREDARQYIKIGKKHQKAIDLRAKKKVKKK